MRGIGVAQMIRRYAFARLFSGLLLSVLLLAVCVARAEQVPMTFDGNASLSYPADAAFELGTEGTIEFWVRADWTGALAEDACVVANGNATTSRYAAYITADGQSVVLWDGTKSAGAAFNFQDGEAHHVAITTRAQQSQFYVDGKLLETRSIGYSGARGLPLHIGTSDGAAEGFQGEIESVRLWSHVLSSGDVALVGTFAGMPSAGSPLTTHLRAYTDFTDTRQQLVVTDPPSATQVAVIQRDPTPVASAALVTPTRGSAQPSAVAGVTDVSTATAGKSPQSVAGPVLMWSMKKPADRWRQPLPSLNVMPEVRRGAIDFWIAWDPNWITEDAHGAVVAYSNGYDTVFEVGMTAAGDGIVMSNGKRDDYGSVVESSNTVSADFTDGQPHHVALVTHEESTEVFVDGVSKGVASVGYAIAQDASGPKTNLQLAIGSFDGRARPFNGVIGAVRIWASPLPGSTLHQAAFLRDSELKTVPWVDAFLLAQIENVVGKTSKPALKVLPPLFLPAGIWMSGTEPAKHRQTQGIGEDGETEWAFHPQHYVQLAVVAPDDPLLAFAANAKAATPVPGAATQRGVGATPSGFVVTPDAGVGGRPDQTLNAMSLEDCAEQCRSAGSSGCAAFDYVPLSQRCEIHKNRVPLRTGLGGSFSFLASAGSNGNGGGTLAKPAGDPREAPVPKLVWLEFTPFQSLDAPESIAVRSFKPNGRNRYVADNGHQLDLTSKIYLKVNGKTLQRFDIPDRPPAPNQTKVDNEFLFGNQIRNLRSALHGWDPVFLNPFDFSDPQGGKKADLFTYPAYGYTQSARMVVPKGFEFIDLQSGNGRKEHTEVKTESELQESLGGMISVGGGVEGMVAAGSFSANASFSGKSKVLESGNSAFTLGQAINRRAALVLDKANARLAEPFVLAVQQAVANNPDIEAARELVEQFGTHYPHGIVLGGRIIEMVELDAHTWGTIESYDIGVGGAVEGRVGPSAGPNASLTATLAVDTGFENSFNQTLQNQKDSWTTSGGQGGAAAGNWSVSDETMAPIYLDLRPLSELLAPPFFMDPAVFDRLRPLVREAMVDYVVRVAEPVSLDSKFVPRAIARQVPPATPKGCDIDRESYRLEFSSDSDNDNGGGAWVQFELPAKAHFDMANFKAGCHADDFWEDGWLIECNRVCWENANFQCMEGKWETQPGYRTSTDVLCHDSGVTEQDSLLKGTGKAPWK